MKKNISVLAVSAFAGLLLLISGCATNTDLHQLNSRVSEMEKRNRNLNSSIEELRGEIATDEGQSNDIDDIRQQFAGQDAEIDRLRSEVRELRGELEETEYRITGKIELLGEDFEKTGRKIESFEEDIDSFDKRISRLEKFMGMKDDEDVTESSSDSESFDKKNLDELKKEELYDMAKQAYDEGDHDTALNGFELFLDKFPDSDRADNARFWIGEVYFAEKWYEKAILEYEKVIQDYPEGNKVPGAYLKQGMAFYKFGENSNARLILQKLLEKYPDSDEAKIAEKQLAIME